MAPHASGNLKCAIIESTLLCAAHHHKCNDRHNNKDYLRELGVEPGYNQILALIISKLYL